MPETARDDSIILPIPRRRWWLKRALGAVVVLVLGLVGLRAWWGAHATRRLDAELADARARGEPTSDAELLAMTPDVPDEQNAATHYRRANAALVDGADPPSQSRLSYVGYPPFPPAWHRLADSSVAANKGAFPHLRAARQCTVAKWYMDPATPSYLRMMPELSWSRQLAHLLGDAALRDHLNGDDAAAIEFLRDVRHIVHSVDEMSCLVSYLTALGIDSMAIERLEVIAGELTIAPTDAAAAAAGKSTSRPAMTSPSIDIKGPASRAQILALIDELLDEREFNESLRRSLLGERVGALDMMHLVAGKSFVLRPMFELDAIQLIRTAETGIRAAEAISDWDAAKSQIGAAAMAAAMTGGKPAPTKKRFSTGLSRSVGIVPGRIFSLHYRHMTERRMAAVMLALQLYRVDHNGQWPTSLDALSPGYLPKLPIDPLDPQKKPIRYVLIPKGRSDGGDRPVVYSVGQDGRDDTMPSKPPGATTAPAPATPPAFPLHDWIDGSRYGVATPDQWRDASRWTSPPVAPWDAITPDDEEDTSDPDAPATQSTTQPGDEI